MIKNINKTFIIIFILCLFGYLINLPIDYNKSLTTRVFRRLLTSNDVTSVTFLPYELINNKKLYFSNITVKAMRDAQTLDSNVYSIIKINDKYFSSYPILTGVMAVPIYLIPVLLDKIPDLQYTENILKILILGRITASIYTSISVAFFYLILKEINTYKKYKKSRWDYLFIFFYAFGTNIYSIASRSLWQHTSSLLFVTIIIWLLLKSINNQKYIRWIGAAAALLYISRPLNLVFIIYLSIFIFFKYKKQFILYLFYSLPFAILLFGYYYYAFGNALTTEYIVKGNTNFSTPLLDGVFGNLFSPARSFIFITPPFIAIFINIYYIIKNKFNDEVDKIIILLTIVFITIFIVYSKWWCWYGADRFGYGFFTEWVPILALHAYILFKPRKQISKTLFLILAIWSIYVQFNAVLFRKSRCDPSHNWTLYCVKPIGLFKKQEY